MIDTGAAHRQEAAPDGVRLVMPLMSKHAVAPTPDNYAVWYQYASGENPALKAEIDLLIAARTPFDDELNRSLFQRHIRGISVSSAQATRRAADMLGKLLSDLATLDAKTASYNARLQALMQQAGDCSEPQQLAALLELLARDTRQLRQSGQALRGDIELRSLEMQALQAELRQADRTDVSDPLTGLPNRRALLDAMSTLGSVTEGPGHALVIIDIDHLQGINDRHGQLIGDRVIRFVADVIRQNIKGQDTPARFGGEEYAILLPNTPLSGALAVAENIRHAIASARLVRSANQEPLGQLSISSGVASSRDGEAGLQLIERANRALGLAKAGGRNRVVPETAL